VLVPTSNVSADDPNLAVLGKISAQLEEIAALLRAGR
jgi:hypothetical protein